MPVEPGSDVIASALPRPQVRLLFSPCTSKYGDAFRSPSLATPVSLVPCLRRVSLDPRVTWQQLAVHHPMTRLRPARMHTMLTRCIGSGSKTKPWSIPRGMFTFPAWTWVSLARKPSSRRLLICPTLQMVHPLFIRSVARSSTCI